MKKTGAGLNWNNYILPMIIIAIMFSILGFAVGINAFFVPFLKKAFNITTAMSYLVTTATFSAFVLFGIPSGWAVAAAIVLIASEIIGIVEECV